MEEPFLCLGIETSCDETAAAVVADGKHILSNVVSSQIPLHARFGGVVPEVASRAHTEAILPVVREALSRVPVEIHELDAVAVVNRPGLVGSLLAGVTAAKTLSWLVDIPLIAVNHVEAHIYANNLAAGDSKRQGGRGGAKKRSLPDVEVEYPAVSLVVSGGHTSLFMTRSETLHEHLGGTLDDAAGEAFDKVASILGLGYPGGPAVERAARRGDPAAVKFARTFLDREGFDFSFSGIKTAVLYRVRGQDARGRGGSQLTKKEIADIAASFQEAVVDVLVGKTLQAVRAKGARSVCVGGGVACNGRLRRKMRDGCRSLRIPVHIPPAELCTDNAAMAAGLAYHLHRAGKLADLFLDARPR